MRARIHPLACICLNFGDTDNDSLVIDLRDQKCAKQLRRNDVRCLSQINQRWRSLATSTSS